MPVGAGRCRTKGTAASTFTSPSRRTPCCRSRRTSTGDSIGRSRWVRTSRIAWDYSTCTETSRSGATTSGEEEGPKRYLRGGCCLARLPDMPGELIGTWQASLKANTVGFRLARVPSGAASPEAKTPPLAFAPFTDADVQRIAALPAEQQVEEVRKELVRRNPGFDGKMEYKIEDGVVTEFRIMTDQVTDIAPIRVFNALRVLECGGTWTNRPNGLLADLKPLEGMNLAALTHLNLMQTKVTDAGIAYFKDCKT